MTKKQNYKKLLYALLALFLLIVAFIGGRGVFPAFADTGYSGVMDDLQKDETFDTSKYPYIADDYSISVFQVAESDTGGLYLYTYQPCQLTTYLVASQVNMSLTDKMGGIVEDETELTDEDKPKLYGLTLINSDGVFCKYKVNDFKVSSNAVRYYNITSVYRVFNKDIDKPTGNDNIVKSVYSKISRCFKAETVDGTVKYSYVGVDTVEIKNPYVDFLSYYNGMTWGSFLGLDPDKYTDVHYIAFSPDRRIDTLKEADVTYRTQSYKIEAFGGGTTYGEKSAPQYITLTGEMEGSTPDGFFASTYSWKCIQRTSDFIKSTGLNEDTYAYSNIKDTEFVLIFLTTPYEDKEVYKFSQGHSHEVSGTKVSNVSILRLMFETDGKVYNLGTLMNQQEGDDIPGNGVKPIGFWAYIWRCIVRLFTGTANAWETVVAVLAMVVCVVLLGLLIRILSLFVPFLQPVWEKIWWVVTLPFRGIKALINKIRGE